VIRAAMKKKESSIKNSGRAVFGRVDAFIQDKISKGRYGFNELVKAGANGGRMIKKPFSYVETFMGDAGVAAIHPSSRYLAARVMRAVEQGRPRVVVKFGAAEGVMTKKILKSLAHDGQLIAIERNDNFYGRLSEMRDTRLRTAHGDVRNMKKILDDMGLAKAIVSFPASRSAFFPPRSVPRWSMTYTPAWFRAAGSWHTCAPRT